MQIKQKIETLEDKLQRIEVRQAENKLSKMINVDKLKVKSVLKFDLESDLEFGVNHKSLYDLFSAVRVSLRHEKNPVDRLKEH